MLYICLFEPEIPQNTGNIARTCAVTGSSLILVKPLGFDISEKSVKRAGLDYWDDVSIKVYENTNEFMDEHSSDSLFFFSVKGKSVYTDEKFPDGDTYFVFGKESKGLDEKILTGNMDRVLRIPMKSDKRSLNLSNSVAIAAYEYYRQKNFETLETKGLLSKHITGEL